jgi:hypothetical protein
MTARRLATVLLLAAAPAQSAAEMIGKEYERRRDDELAEAGQRHLRLGSWARDQGLVPQATAQFLAAVDVSKGKCPGATTVLSVMRAYGDAFWTKKRQRPPRALIAEFERRAAAVDKDDRKAHRELAQRALKARRQDASKEHWLEVLRLGGELEVDPKGVWRLDGERVPDELAEWLQQQTTRVNGDRPVFEAAGGGAPRLPDAKEHACDKLAVRTDLPGDASKELHALGVALWPHLQERLDGAPTRRLRLFVFHKRSDYAAYLKARGREADAVAPGLTDYGTSQTLVCAEGLAPEDVHALVLHELSHLFFFHVAPAAMPAWYAEGFAETFGGQDTFAWDGKKLTVGGLLRRDRIDDLKQNPIPVADLVAGGGHDVLYGQDRQRAHRFYAASWALQRFLLDPACQWNARFLHFEQKCRGQVLASTQACDAVFQSLFGQDLAKMQEAFTTFLRAL